MPFERTDRVWGQPCGLRPVFDHVQSFALNKICNRSFFFETTVLYPLSDTSYSSFDTFHHGSIPISATTSRKAASKSFTSDSKMRPMVPIRKHSAWLTLPG